MHNNACETAKILPQVGLLSDLLLSGWGGGGWGALEAVAAY